MFAGVSAVVLQHKVEFHKVTFGGGESVANRGEGGCAHLHFGKHPVCFILYCAVGRVFANNFRHSINFCCSKILFKKSVKFGGVCLSAGNKFARLWKQGVVCGSGCIKFDGFIFTGLFCRAYEVEVFFSISIGKNN